MKNTIILIIVLFIAVFAVSGLYFSRLNQRQNVSKQYIATIPANASILLSFNNDSTLFDLFKDYKGFELILGKEEMQELKTLKNIFLDNRTLAAITNQQPIYLSFHNEKDNIFWLLTMPLNNNGDPELFKSNLDPAITIETVSNQTADFFELKVPSIQQKVYASIQPDRATFSFSKPLLERALNKQSDHLSDLFLEKFQENNYGNNSPLQLYINHARLEGLLASITKKTKGTIDLFNSLNGLSMFDLNYKSDVLMFSGTSSIIPSDSSYLSLFITQEPVTHQLKNWLPKNVAEVATYGLSNYKEFHSGFEKILEKRNEIKQLREQLRYIEDKNGLVIDDELLTLWGSEFAKLVLESGEEIGLIAIRDSLEYSIAIQKISTLGVDSVIRQFDNSNLLYYSLGDPFLEFKRPYFAYAKGYLIVANHQATLNDYLDRLNSEDLLIDDEEYLLYDKLQSTSSNFSLFIHRKNSHRLTERNLKPPFLKNYNDTENFGFQKFYAFSLQLSGNKDHFLVNLYGKFDTGNPLLEE